MSTVTESPVRHIKTIDRKLQSLTEQKIEAIAQMLRDFEWMDIPVLQIKEVFIDGPKDQDLREVHVLETIWFDDRTQSLGDFRVHDAGMCPAEGKWCRKIGETHRPRGRSRIGFNFTGIFHVVARHDRTLYVIPTEMLPKAVA